MHEYHGAVQIIEHAQDMCRERGHNKVNKIQLLIGEASGYTFEVVKEYFDEVAIGTVCEGAEVTVRKTDVMLRKELGEHFADTTTIIIAQRISSVMHADHILVLEEGQMLGLGTHEELMESCEIYREIAASQMGV